MLIPSLVTNRNELIQILELQKLNLKQNLSETEKYAQGFVTLEHSLTMLEQMHALAPSVIIKDKDQVVAYALSELVECRNIVPALEPMFSLLDQIEWNGRALSSMSYYVMGQICIDKEYRSKGLFEQLYFQHRKEYRERFDLFVTEISNSNYRSLRAHARVGFKTIHQHRDEIDDWMVVGWDWKDPD